jgi:hypothetical protein
VIILELMLRRGFLGNGGSVADGILVALVDAIGDAIEYLFGSPITSGENE